MSKRRPTKKKAAPPSGKPARKAAPKTKAKPRRPSRARVHLAYDFEEGNRDMKYLLGGKGANLAEMTNMGLPVPHGFTVTCEACNDFRKAGRRFPEGMLEEAFDHLE